MQKQSYSKTVAVSDTFYRDFEAKFRGNRSTISDRLRVYLPFVRPLVAEGNALDLGCGRGEWLELLAEAGMNAHGVDLDDGMLDEALKRGLSVERKDALEALRTTPDGTQAIVSMFHLAEHLPFDVLRALFTEAARVLRPGGVLIVETPNPENLVVGLINFHLDATHVRPIPPILMSFLADYSGFARNTTLRLQGKTPCSETAGDLMSLLTDVSLDYAIVAQTKGTAMGSLDGAFALELGTNLIDGVARFDRSGMQQRQFTEVLQDRIKGLEDGVEAFQAKIKGLEDGVEAFQAKIKGLEDGVEAFQAKIKDLEDRAEAFQANASYRLNRSFIERLFFRASGRPVRALRRVLFHSSGKPRGIFRKWVLDQQREPKRAFAHWMGSKEYLSLPWPASRRAPLQPLLEPTEKIEFDGHPLRAELLEKLDMLVKKEGQY
jgi:O-antigen chain-terminating methyltransferase